MSSLFGESSLARLARFVPLLAALVTACGDDPTPTDAPSFDATLDRAPDVITVEDVPVAQDGDDVGDRLLCEAMCARMERSRCALFDRDVCERECVASVMSKSARCRSEIELSLRCRASGTSYVCDDRGLPAPLQCGDEAAALSRCTGVSPDAGDAGDASDVSDASDASDVTDVTDESDASDVTDVGDDVNDDVADATDDASDTEVVDVSDASDDVSDASDDAGDATSTSDASDAGPVDPCVAPSGTITMPGAAFTRSETASGRSLIPAALCAPDAVGPERVWRLEVTARTGVVIDTEGTPASTGEVVSVRRTCDDIRTELLCDDSAGRDNTALVRAIVDPGSYSLVVDSTNTAGGPYNLRVRSFTPAPNSTCTSAIPLAPGATLSAQNAANGGLRRDHCRASAAGGPLFYSVVVPATNRVTVTARPTGATAWAPVLGAVTACTATACAAQSAGETAGAGSTVALLNTSSSPMTWIVSVANGAGSDGMFDISASAPLSVAPGSTCASAPVLTAGTARAGQDLANAFQHGASLCLSGFTGPQLYYVLRVGARQRGTVTVTPRGTMAPVIRLVRSCLATACDASTQGPAGAPLALSFDNPDAVSVDVVVAVSNAAGAGGTFDIVSAVGAIPVGVTCASPTTLTAGTSSLANTLNGTMSGASSCDASVTGPQLFYLLRIPAGQRGTVRAMPTGTTPWRPTLRAFDSCIAPLCTQSSTAAAVGMAATLSIDNNTAAARDVIFTVAGSGTTPGGAVDVLATLTTAEPPPYTVTTIPVACDAMSTAPPVAPLDGWDDDTATEPAALPFAMRLFSASPTHYAACSNGFVQLFTSESAEPSIADVNAAMPSNRDPNGVVAPFWDDLTPLDETTDVRVATIGAIPRRRFVVQWSNWQVIGDTESRLTFQAKLFEGTGVIEYHYCSATPARTLPLGASATIGVESLDGTAGVTVAFNRFNAVDPANAVRLTPR